MNGKSGFFGLFLFVGWLTAGASAIAQQPARFDFVYEGAASSARAVGFVVFDLDQLPNPGMVTYSLPDSAISDLQVTVTGAASGNGNFGLADFAGVSWSTGDNSGSLDLSPGQQVVGQPAPFESHNWGPLCPPLSVIIDPPLENPCGRFLLEGTIPNRGALSAAPVASDPGDRFTIRADGGTADEMRLTSFVRGTPSNAIGVPALSATAWWLMALMLLAVAWIIPRARP